MKLRFIQYFYIIAAVTAFGPGCAPQTIIAAEQTAPAPMEEFEVLASGPIHEAFAEAVAFDPEPGIEAPKAPPALIEEIPPEQKPEGDVQWIPGYWAWDDERDDYIWVSGIWRVPPPDRQWIPGYWTPSSEGYQWISGYWAGAKEKETEYLPEPPESVEVGPSSNAPSADYTWVPGCWVYDHQRYAWQPGYWALVRPDWIWVPAHYIWSPRGYIFVSGYWDYTVIHRGVLFAPVFFPHRMHLGLTFSFSPGFVISLDVFDDALFLRPRYRHYYYGDYYAPRHYRRGIYPWFSLHARRVVYDPIYAHQRWRHRNDHGWENRLQSTFRDRRDHEHLRPPRSFDRRTGPDRAVRSTGPKRPDFVMPLNRAGKSRAGDYRFKPLSERERRGFSEREKEVRTYQKERQNRETRRQPAVEGRTPERRDTNKERFPRSPIMDRSGEKGDRKKAPPALDRTPKPNPDVEPLERGHDSSRRWSRPRRTEEGVQGSEVRRQRSIDDARERGNRGGYRVERMQRFFDRQERRDDESRGGNGR